MRILLFVAAAFLVLLLAFAHSKQSCARYMSDSRYVCYIGKCGGNTCIGPDPFTGGATDWCCTRTNLNVAGNQ